MLVGPATGGGLAAIHSPSSLKTGSVVGSARIVCDQAVEVSNDLLISLCKSDEYSQIQVRRELKSTQRCKVDKGPILVVGSACQESF